MVICRVELGWRLISFCSSVGGLDLRLDLNLPLIYLGTNLRSVLGSRLESELGSNLCPDLCLALAYRFSGPVIQFNFWFCCFSSILLEALI